MRQVALLRGINLGPKRRVPMADLRARLTGAGYEEVETYVQSGNIVLETELEPGALAATLATQLEDWCGFAIPVVVRSGEELERIVDTNPLSEIAVNDKYHVVTFLDREPDPDAVSRVAAIATGEEGFAHRGREIFTFYPRGQARSKLALALTDAKLGVLATARNWTTVMKLTELAAR